MPTYTFHLRKPGGAPIAFDMVELAHDSATFAKAGELLADHPSCGHIEVWDGDRPVLSRHREQPIIRGIEQPSRHAAPQPARF
jgi:hypothetical protein